MKSVLMQDEKKQKGPLTPGYINSSFTWGNQINESGEVFSHHILSNK